MRRIKQAVAFMLTLVLILTLPSISTYANNNYNGLGGGSGSVGNTSSAGGASDRKCGYRMYIVDSEGEVVSPVVDLVTDPAAAKACNKPVFTTRIGNGAVGKGKKAKNGDIQPMPSGMPKPYYYNGGFKGNGTALRDWALKKNKANQNKILAVVYEALGKEYYDMFDPKKSDGSYNLILEPIAWHSIYLSYTEGSKTSDSGYGTFYNWMQIYSKYQTKDGHKIGRSTYTSSLDQNVLGNCMVLEKDQLGLSKPTTKPTNHTLTALSNKGYGIHIYSNNAKTTPYTVVAGYITWYGDGDISNYADGGKVETDDIIKAGDRPANIFVADKVGHSMASSDTEENAKKGYELMSWVVTDAKKNDKKLIPIATADGALTWYTTMAGESQQSGDRRGVVKLDENMGL